MSLQSQTSRDLVRIERLSTVQSSTGGQIRTYSQENRGTLPTTLRCRIQPVSVRERIALGMRGSQQLWKFLFHADPQVTVEDRFCFQDANANWQTVRILVPSRNLDGQSRMFSVMGESVENEQ